MGWLSRLFGGGEKEAKMEMEPGIEMAKDPVCGMEVNIDKAAATSTHQGQTYYFCAVGCKKAFDADPEKYLAGSGAH